jgi:hypothetical protein
MSDNQFDDVIHVPNRLKICAFLAPIGAVEFHLLRDALEVSDSVLSKYIKHLETTEYV